MSALVLSPFVLQPGRPCDSPSPVGVLRAIVDFRPPDAKKKICLRSSLRICDVSTLQSSTANPTSSRTAFLRTLIMRRQVGAERSCGTVVRGPPNMNKGFETYAYHALDASSELKTFISEHCNFRQALLYHTEQSRLEVAVFTQFSTATHTFSCKFMAAAAALSSFVSLLVSIRSVSTSDPHIQSTMAKSQRPRLLSPTKNKTRRGRIRHTWSRSP